MKNPKVIIIAAAAGFFLSFFIALIAGAGFGAALLRAVVSAAVCAAVVAGLSAAAQKFLLEDTQTAGTDETRENGEAGSVINIVLEDEGLTAEPDDPLFSVSDVGKSLGKPLAGQGLARQAPITLDAEARLAAIDAASPRKARQESAENKDADAQASEAGFTPANITSIAASVSMTDFTKDEAAEFPARKASMPQTFARTAEPAAKTAPARSGAQGAGLIDLPDIGMLVTEGVSTDNDIVRDTEFASATKDEVASGHRIRAPEDIDISDSKAIAGAIRTLLVNG